MGTGPEKDSGDPPSGQTSPPNTMLGPSPKGFPGPVPGVPRNRHSQSGRLMISTRLASVKTKHKDMYAPEAIITGAAVFLPGPHGPRLDGTSNGDQELAAKTRE